MEIGVLYLQKSMSPVFVNQTLVLQVLGRLLLGLVIVGAESIAC